MPHEHASARPLGRDAQGDDVRVFDVDGGQVDHARTRPEQALGELGRGLGVGRHGGVERGLLVGGGAHPERPGEHRQDGDQLAAAFDRDQPHRLRAAERLGPRPQPSGAHERRRADAHRQPVPALDERGRERLQNPASHHRGDLPFSAARPRWGGRSAGGYWRGPGRTRNRPVLAALTLALVAVLQLSGCTVVPGRAVAAPADGGPRFGTLVSRPEHAADEMRAGVSAAMVELSWAQAEPRPGQFDLDYLNSVRGQVDTLRAAGRSIALGLGMHATPDWVSALPDARFVDQDGNVSNEVNLVFAQNARTAAEGYLAQLATQLDLSKFDAIRLTSGGSPEVLYPGGSRYWAFDRHAQTGDGLPPSMPPNPLPGWRPGTPGADPAQVRSWADWYVKALDDVVTWQIGALGKLGFHGRYEIVTPGVGVQPRAYDRAVQSGLPPGLLGSGAAWQVFYAGLPRRPDVVAYVSSVADSSGGDDDCQPGDDAVALDAVAPASWSATRWIATLARRSGFAVSGENPGWHQSNVLDARYVDVSDTGMMAAAVRQARSCGLDTFYWAHDTQLWDGTVPFDRYAQLIALRWSYASK